MKKLAVLLILSSIITVGCSSETQEKLKEAAKDKAVAVTKDVVKKVKKEIKEEIKENDPNRLTAADISSDWHTGELIIDNKIYNLPLSSYEELLNEGWYIGEKYTERTKEEYKPGDIHEAWPMRLYNNKYEDVELTIHFRNTTDTDQKLKNCEIYEIRLDASKMVKKDDNSYSTEVYYELNENHPDIILPGGIELGDTLKEVEKKIKENNLGEYTTDNMIEWSRPLVFKCETYTCNIYHELELGFKQGNDGEFILTSFSYKDKNQDIHEE